MRNKGNNKGLSLVELVVAIAIFAIAGAAICGFVIFCTHQFTGANRTVALQYEQQIVVNRVRDIILETSRGISYDEANNRLLVFSDNPDYIAESDSDAKAAINPYIITELSFTKADGDDRGKLYIAEGTFPKGTVLSGITFGDGSRSVLSESLSVFKLVDFDKNLANNKVVLEMTFKVGDKEITVNPVICLRNILTEIKEDTDLSDVYKKEVIEVYSHVQKIEIVRDGKIFAQSKTDTIKMAGDSTAVDYDAIVTKKANYKEAIKTTASWELDISTLKEGYEKCISIDKTTGVVTLRIIDEAGTKLTPLDFMNGDYFVIKAISDEDTSKIARLRIKVVTEGGVYPESITTKTPYEYKKDLNHGALIYTFEHEITYTDLVEDPVTKAKVNPLTGKGVYSKIKYTVTSSDGSMIPKGAGFIEGDNVNGEFVVTKSMEEKTYHIVVTVVQKDKNGEAVKDEFDLFIEKDSVPKVKPHTVPVLKVQDTALRGEFNTMSASWSSGVPTYPGKKTESDDYGHQVEVDVTETYRYFYEWEIEPVNPDVNSPTWGNDERNKFSNIYFSKMGNKYDNKGSKYTSVQTERNAAVYVQPYLDWDKKFVYKVSLRVKLSKTKDEPAKSYYMEPGTDPSNEDNIITDDINKAYVCSALVVINPVKFKLKQAPESIVLYNNNQQSQGKYNSVMNASTDIGLGLKHDHNIYYCDKQEHDYYKIFEPEFEGISVTIFNYTENLKGIMKEIEIKDQQGKVVDRISNLQTYTKTNTGYEYKLRDVKGYSVDWIVPEKVNKLYFYLKMKPAEWITTDQMPLGARWQCMVYDDKGNSAKAIFEATNNEYMDYKFHNHYEGDY